MLSPMVVFKGAAHYRGWYTEVTDEKHAYFTYSPKGMNLIHIYQFYPANSSVIPKGYTTDEIGLDWLKKIDAHTRPTEVAECRLLLLDGHHFHYNLHFGEYA